VVETQYLAYNPIDIEALTLVLNQYQGLHHNQIVTDFEAAIQQLTGSPYVLALNSGTAAIHLGLLALGVGPADYVFVSTFTFMGSVNPILYAGANPVFIDSEEQTWNMDPQLLERALHEFQQKGQLPKAIVVVHTYGMPAKMDEILALAHHYNVPVLEDAAEAIGSYYKGTHAGNLGQVGVLSFNNNKTVTTFGGGMLLTPHKHLYEKAKALATHTGSKAPAAYAEPGHNYKMGPLNAAMGLASLNKLEISLKQKAEIFHQYAQHLAALPGVQVQQQLLGHRSNYWLSCLLLPAKKEHVAQALAQRNIETRPAWPPLHKQPKLAHHYQYTNQVAEQLHANGLCLPSGQNLTPQTLQELTNAIKILLC
jgi:dTDP-4-amino-4,6-dideoxygalactose transaminase